MHGIGRINLNKVNNHQEECLNILQEECAELMRNDPKYWKLLEHFGIKE